MIKCHRNFYCYIFFYYLPYISNFMMKAIYYTETGPASEVLKVGNFEIPKIGENDVLLKMQYSSVNPADTKKRSGWLGASLDKEFIIPHTDGAGTDC